VRPAAHWLRPPRRPEACPDGGCPVAGWGRCHGRMYAATGSWTERPYRWPRWPPCLKPQSGRACSCPVGLDKVGHGLDGLKNFPALLRVRKLNAVAFVQHHDELQRIDGIQSETIAE